MTTLIRRATAGLNPYLRPLSRLYSFRQYSTGPASSQDKRIKTSLAPRWHELVQKFKNTHRFETPGKTLRYFLALGIGSLSIASWLFNSLFEAASEHSNHEELNAIAQKQGVLWECIGRTRNETGGYIYHFRLRKEYDFDSHKLEENYDEDQSDLIVELRGDASMKKIEEIFPAGEPTEVSDILELAPQIRQDLGYGYRYDKSGIYLSFPDKEALEANFEKLRRFAFGNLEPLKICPSEGVADDLSFLKAYVDFDVLLSSDKEFVHDHFFHVIPTLHLMITESQYAYERDRVRKIVTKLYQRIILAEKEGSLKEHLPQTITAIAAAVDSIWAIRTIKDLQRIKMKTFKSEFPNILKDNPSSRNYWQKRFSNAFDCSIFKEVWRQMKEIEQLSNHD